MVYIKVNIKLPDTELTEMLIAQLEAIGFDGFEENAGSLLAYIAENNFNEIQLTSLLNQYAVQFTIETVPEQNWNANWEANFSPVVLENFLAIRASFHDAISNVEHEIIITPKMSFGTGHHPTTFLVMQLMQQINFSQKAVFDFGTGTGILAILAEKLGASSVYAVDCDAWSIQNAVENFAMNHTKNCNIQQANNAATDQNFDIILANVNRNIILDNLHYFINCLSPKGLILLSGLLVSDAPEIKNMIQHKSTWQQKAILEKEGWIAFLYEA
ncbi:50S ribosomal protein L11 methyltransferase [Hydrotalea flava]|uniref:50S ribosomal protein L11 methyltransferase n=1 Tax=Hydrotalea flava TaxID=714549 RepID=UPI00082E06A3|nr:50S ribosomal protein L11 methyltransferase [Hydrotalea flava]